MLSFLEISKKRRHISFLCYWIALLTIDVFFSAAKWGSGPWVRVRQDLEMHILAPDCGSGNTNPKKNKHTRGNWREFEVHEDAPQKFIF